VANDHGAAVIDRGTLGTRQGDMATRLRTRPSKATPRVCVDDAGPRGAWRSRDRRPNGSAGWGVAPALLPQTAGDRGQTDRREAVPLARLTRSGALTPVSVPAAEDEALRALRRARDAAIGALQTATCRRNACLRRQDLRETGRAPWRPAQRRGLAAVGGPPPAPPLVFQDDVRAVNEPTARLPRLDQARHDPGDAGRWRPVVAALQALRGVPCPAAVPLAAALGALTRVDTPRQRRPCGGLLPAASARGERRRPGAIPKAGPPPGSSGEC
jgi:transposase